MNLWRIAGLLFPALLAAAPAPGATVSGKLTIEGADVAGAVIYLEAANPPAAPAPGRVVMDQKNLAFVPRVLPIVRGTEVEFINSDSVEHNVFSPSLPADKFDLGTYRRGQTRSVRLDKPGEVLVLCNIHMEMAANIVVLRDPYFALSERYGSYRISGVPAGEYTLTVWHGSWLSYKQSVIVPPGETFVLDVSAPR